MNSLQFSLAFCLAFAFSGAGARAAEGLGPSSALFAPLPEGAYDQAPSGRAYETAMTRYEVLLDQRTSGDEVAVFFIPVLEDQVWTWQTDDGAVRRLARGLFRISFGSCLSGFCAEIDCRDAGWPTFECSDGQPRDMAAPDASTVTFGDVTYTRARPLSAEEGERATDDPGTATDGGARP